MLLLGIPPDEKARIERRAEEKTNCAKMRKNNFCAKNGIFMKLKQ